MKKTLILCLILLFAGCAKRTHKIESVSARPSWMATDALYNDRNFYGEYLIHPFFDLVPFSSKVDNSMNFVMTTPVGAQSKYEIDLRSGRLYRKHNFCSQEDIWKKYTGTINRPPYTEGIIPRLLDQLGSPQKIIVFGKSRYFHKFEIAPTRSQRVRIVGGVLLQYCNSYPCRGYNKWQSRILLVGVSPTDPEFKKINNLNQLKKVVDWDESVAFIQNSNGRKLSGNEPRPSYRIVGNIGPKEAFKISLSKGHLFNFDEMKTIRSSCQALYDYTWKTVKAIRSYEVHNKLSKDMPEKNITKVKVSTDTFSGNVVSAERLDDRSDAVLQKEMEIKDFAYFFKHFYLKYKDRYKTCQQFVRDTSINSDKERMWFFSYLTSFFNTEEAGYMYSCSRTAWVKNPVTNSGERLYSLKKSIKNCTTRELNTAFDMSINIQAGLSSSSQDHFRFIEYDHGNGASHQKIYSWVRDLGDGYVCDKDRRQKLSIFPQDVNWVDFGDSKTAAEDLIVR